MAALRPLKPRCCELCLRAQPLSFHHLIPRKNHRRPLFQKRFTKEELRRGLWLCRLCHSMLHRTFSERALGLELNTREAILAESRVQAFLAWAKKQK